MEAELVPDGDEAEYVPTLIYTASRYVRPCEEAVPADGAQAHAEVRARIQAGMRSLHARSRRHGHGSHRVSEVVGDAVGEEVETVARAARGCMDREAEGRDRDEGGDDIESCHEDCMDTDKEGFEFEPDSRHPEGHSSTSKASKSGTAASSTDPAPLASPVASSSTDPSPLASPAASSVAPAVPAVHKPFWLTRTSRGATCSGCQGKIAPSELRLVYEPGRSTVTNVRVWRSVWWTYHHLEAACIAGVVTGFRDSDLQMDIAPLAKRAKESDSDRALATEAAKARLLAAVAASAGAE